MPQYGPPPPNDPRYGFPINHAPTYGRPQRGLQRNTNHDFGGIETYVDPSGREFYRSVVNSAEYHPADRGAYNIMPNDPREWALTEPMSPEDYHWPKPSYDFNRYRPLYDKRPHPLGPGY